MATRPSEPEHVTRMRAQIHTIRVQLLRAGQRLGYGADNALVRQVMYRWGRGQGVGEFVGS